jgi:hypothetical protein
MEDIFWRVFSRGADVAILWLALVLYRNDRFLWTAILIYIVFKMPWSWEERT